MQNQGSLPELTPAPMSTEVLYRRKAYPFVDHGTVFGFALQERLVQPVIGREESAIVALLAMKCRLTYGITGGKSGHLFYFHPAFGVSHVGRLGTGPVTGGSLADVGNETILGGWWGPEGGGLFRHDGRVEAALGMEQFMGKAAAVEVLGAVKAGEGVGSLVFDAGTRTAYGLTVPGGFLFSLAVDAADRRAQLLAQVRNAATVLVLLPDGRLLGASTEGRLWTFAPDRSELTALDACAPCQAGKRYVAAVQSLTAASDGQVYGGTETDGYLFRFDPASGELVNLGKPNRQSCIRALAEGHDGLIYGIVEEPKGMAHLFSYDPRGRGFCDLGVVGANSPEHWVAHSIGSMSVGPFGEVFLGETDAISHLFVYYPPVNKQRRAES